MSYYEGNVSRLNEMQTSALLGIKSRRRYWAAPTRGISRKKLIGLNWFVNPETSICLIYKTENAPKGNWVSPAPFLHMPSWARRRAWRRLHRLPWQWCKGFMQGFRSWQIKDVHLSEHSISWICISSQFALQVIYFVVNSICYCCLLFFLLSIFART